jgi:hypothetical protein
MIVKTHRNLSNLQAVEREAKTVGVRGRYPANYYLAMRMYQLTQVQNGKMLFCVSIVGESAVLLWLKVHKHEHFFWLRF